MSDRVIYYRSAWEDSNEFLDIAQWIIKGKEKQHLACKMCK